MSVVWYSGTLVTISGVIDGARGSNRPSGKLNWKNRPPLSLYVGISYSFGFQ